MFGLFRNKKMDLYAPVKGECIAIEDVPDPVFSNKLLGDGIAFKPLNNTIFSPCDGTITMVAETKHALGLKAKNGTEIMIHVGLDTVNYNGKGFKCFVSNNQKVKKGQKLIEIDLDFFRKENANLTTPMVIITKDINLTIISNKGIVDNDSVVVKLGDEM